MINGIKKRFKRFIKSPNFQAVYALDKSILEEIESDDIALLEFGYRFLRQVLFGEKTIDLKNDAVVKRAEERKDYWKARHDAEMEYANLNVPRYDPKVMGDEVMGDNKLAEKAEAAKKDQE